MDALWNISQFILESDGDGDVDAQYNFEFDIPMGFLASEQNYLYTTKTKVEAAEDET
jgi:hypothetical protein